MSIENLSEEHVARYGRFVGDPTPREQRRGYNRLGWAVQWGTVRMLGTFLTKPAQVPPVVAEFVAEQLGGVDASSLAQYPDREQALWDHAREVRDLLGIREFDAIELELRAFVAAVRGCPTRGRESCSTGRWCG
ncbi:DUF4158 domain-containing protein [Catenulispora subtropica]|uniref:DUF4158 domain-containing protein n=1 Tax=Catenulispora subtropica TaxID=450798 RepID=A0ABP5EAC6_9ACTN